ncbi:MAG: fibronectin type III domain-containing protein [Melioribacteraceae bacterium]|nr:fibronectin type III domain-containing protein [Melioribacteraceae bacterium]
MKKLILFILLFPLITFAQLPVTPADAATGVSVGLASLTWTAFGGGTYDAELHSNNTYTALVASSYGGAGTSLAVPGATLQYNRTYYWRVQDAANPGSWSNYSFTVELATPALTSPANNATGVSVPSLSWTLAASTTNVEFYLDYVVDGTFDGDETIVNLAVSPHIIGPLLYNTTYYWRVRALVNGAVPNNGETTTSAVRTFTTVLATPVLTAPANAAINQSINPSLSWSLVASTTNVEYYIDYDDDGELILDKQTDGPFLTSPQSIGPLLYDTPYIWQVRAVVTAGPPNAGEETTSATRTFTTEELVPTLVAPAQYALQVSVLTTFEWDDILATDYDLEISTDPNMAGAIVFPGIVGTTYTLDTFEYLDYNQVYYWRIKENDFNVYSEIRQFKTWSVTSFSVSAVPMVTSAYLTLQIFPTPLNTVRYDIFYRKSIDPWPVAPQISNQQNIYSYNLTGLSAGTQYDVLIRAKNNPAGTIVYCYSAVITFTTDGLPTPALAYPVGGETTYGNPPTVSWYLGTLFTGQFQIRWSYDPSTDFDGMLDVAATNLTLTTNIIKTFPTALTTGVPVYWQVRCYDGAVYGPWSLVEEFEIYSTNLTVAPKPVPSWPIGGNDSYLNPPTLYWYTGTFTTDLDFYVEWDDANDFITPLGNSGWFTEEPFFKLPSSLAPGTYYWRVKSRLTATLVEGVWSDVVSFVIPAPLATSVAMPNPLQPNSVSVTTLNPTFTWYAVTPPALTYKLRISPYYSTDANGMLNHPTAVQTTTWLNTTSAAFNSMTFTAPGLSLLPGVTYYWQVIAKNGSNVESSWSYIVSFITAAGASAIVPELVSPIQGQPINATSAVLTWSLPAQPETQLKYDLEYSKSADFSDAVKKTLNEKVIQVDGLDPNSTYYWRVSSKNTAGSQSMFSNVQSFRTDGATSVGDNEAIPNDFALMQNYPNPFNPTTKITFSLPSDNFVTVKVYDMLGREVKTLVNDYRNAGNHTMNWNGDDNSGQKVASGTYIYRITAGSFVATKKMVLLK